MSFYSLLANFAKVGHRLKSCKESFSLADLDVREWLLFHSYVSIVVRKPRKLKQKHLINIQILPFVLK